MPVTTFFQFCPICGRGVLIAVEYLGQPVVCNHCRGRFQARDTSYDDSSCDDAREPTLIDRANTLLACSTSGSSSNRLADFPFP